MTLSASLWMASILLALPAAALQDPCSKFGLSPAPGDLGYLWRKNRCEGLFARSVAGELDLRLVSFAAGLAQLDPASTGAVQLGWKAPSALPVQLRAISLKQRHYYRMDAEFSAPQDSFNWPTDILQRERLKGPDLGIVAFVQEPSLRDTYLPLILQSSAELPEIRLLPGTELSEVKYSIDQLSPSGSPTKTVVALKDLALGYYPAGRSFRVPLPPGLPAGFYRLNVDSAVKSGGSVAKKYTLYWPKSTKSE